MLFGEIRQPDSNYLIIPRHSSERRSYIPLGYETPDVICGDSCMILPDASLCDFGILISSVHMAWMRVVAGRLKSDYRYSAAIVYNNFPWPRSMSGASDESELIRRRIEKTAQSILDARDLYPESSLADLYDPLTMPPELRKAHQLNDAAVLDAYDFNSRMSEDEIVARLLGMYAELTVARAGLEMS